MVAIIAPTRLRTAWLRASVYWRPYEPWPRNTDVRVRRASLSTCRPARCDGRTLRVVLEYVASCRNLGHAQVLPGPRARIAAGSHRYARGARELPRQARELRGPELALRLPAHPCGHALPGAVPRRPVRRVDQHREVAPLAGLPVRSRGARRRPPGAARAARVAAGRPHDDCGRRRRPRAGRDAGRGGQRIRCARGPGAQPDARTDWLAIATTKPPSATAPPAWCAGHRSRTN